MNSMTLSALAASAQIIAIILGVAAYKVQTRETKEDHTQLVEAQQRTSNDVNATVNRALADVVEAANPQESLAELRRGIARLGSHLSDPPSLVDNVERPDITAQVQSAIQRIPSEITQQRKAQLDALLEEAEAQKLAEEIEGDFRPRIAEVQSLIVQVLETAADQNLVDISNRSPMFELPSQIVFTTFAMAENNIPEERTDETMTVSFADGTTWEFYLKYGMVQSPATLAKSWDGPTRKYYPMIRLRQNTEQASEVLATIWFHQDTKNLHIAFNARNTARDSRRDAVDALEKEQSGKNLVSAVLVELLKEVRFQ